MVYVVKRWIKNESDFPLCEFLGPTSSGVFSTKMAISSSTTISVDSYSYITSTM